MSFLEIKGVSFDYPNGFRAVQNVDLSIAKGEKVAIIGQNGAGKTTTVKLMNGLMKPTLGDVFVDGWNTKDYTTAQISRKVGYVFQNPDDQIFHNDVLSEVAFGPKMLGFSKDKIDSLVKLSTALTGIERALKVNPYNLPFSTRKFVTIASVIAMDSEVLIFDEPTAGQDLVGMNILGTVIDKLTEMGKTVITITHDMEFVVNNFDRVIVMANKQVIADSDKQTVFWDHEVLNQAKLKQPYISDLAHNLHMDQNVLCINQFIDNLNRRC